MPRPKTITKDGLANLLSLTMTVVTYRDELVHRVKAGARIERGTWTLRKYPPSYPEEPLVIRTLDYLLATIDELEGKEETEAGPCAPDAPRPH